MIRRFVAGLALTIGSLLIVVGAQAAFQPTASSSSNAEFTDQACLDCHADEARLRELAPEEPEVVEEAPSEGPG